MQLLDALELKGKKVLVRVDFNVPLNDAFQVTDANRIRGALPTMKKIIGDGGRLILMSHLGRPISGPEARYSLKHILSSLEEHLGQTVKFAGDCVGPEVTELADGLKDGEVLLLENLRFYEGEKKGDRRFAQALSKLGDIYLNDAFGTAHRAHASTSIIAEFYPKEAKSFGYLMQKEIENAEMVLKHSKKPFTAIVGGAKVSDKILILENLLNIADNIIIGGGMAYTFIAVQKGKIGMSLLEEERLTTAKRLLEAAEDKGVKILLPEDSRVTSDFSNVGEITICASDNIPADKMGLDIGVKASKTFCEVISKSKTILWNGPMGVFEFENFAHGTLDVAKAISDATANGAFSLVGGGDSVAALNKLQMADKVSYVSTGGGAMLTFLEGKTLPGIAAIIE